MGGLSLEPQQQQHGNNMGGVRPAGSYIPPHMRGVASQGMDGAPPPVPNGQMNGHAPGPWGGPST